MAGLSASNRVILPRWMHCLMRQRTVSIVKNADRVCWLCSACWLAFLLAACGTPVGGTRTSGSVQSPAPNATHLSSPISTDSSATAAPTIQATTTTDTGASLLLWLAALYQAE